MEEYREFAGSTLEEAKEKARDYFNSNHIEYELLPPKFLTVITGRRDVRIRAAKKEVTEEYLIFKQKARELLETILKEANLSVSISEVMADDTIRYDLTGEDVHLLSEDKGKLLESIQHIIAKATSKDNPGVNVVVDAEGFKKEREEYLKGYVGKICENVRKSNRSYILKPLNPSERRIVHLMVQVEGDLVTESLGDGYYKKIKISKLKNEPNK